MEHPRQFEEPYMDAGAATVRPSGESGSMREGLTITATTGDADLEQYRIQACNRYFAGTVDVYALPGSPQNWADQLSGFPRNLEDSRRLCCGLSDSVRAGGLVELRFACVDTSGHVHYY